MEPDARTAATREARGLGASRGVGGATVWVAAAAILAWAGEGAAQQVKGRVVEEGTGSPVAGALTSLLDRDGTAVASTLTGPDGAFAVAAPSPGAYRVRVRRVGYETWTSAPLVLEDGETRSFRARVPVRAIRLEGLEVAPGRTCGGELPVGTRPARLWQEARKALAATERTREEARVRLEMRRWHRVLGENGRVEEETDHRSAGVVLRPFRSPPAEELAREGYVRDAGDGRVWYAPDARTLLSDSFRRNHCFWIREQGAPEGWIGLAFRPVEEQSRPDVTGVLWVDRATFELLRLEFGYVNADLPDDARDVGGEIAFQRVPGGGWIVRAWRIRMPRVGLDQYHEQVTAGYEVDGGEVVAAYDDAGRRLGLARRATLLGRSAYGGSGPPAAGASIVLSGTGRSTGTDSLGRFRMDMLPAGRYAVEIRPPAVGELGIAVPAGEVELEAGETREVELSLPDRGSLARRLCPGDERRVALAGRVRDAGGDPAAGSEVRVRWERRAGAAGAGPRAKVVTSTDSAGAYVVRDVPPGRDVGILASAGVERSPEARVTLPREGIARRDLELEPAPTATPGLRGSRTAAPGTARAARPRYGGGSWPRTPDAPSGAPRSPSAAGSGW